MVKGDRKKEEEKGRREKRRGNKDERGGETGEGYSRSAPSYFVE